MRLVVRLLAATSHEPVIQSPCDSENRGDGTRPAPRPASAPRFAALERWLPNRDSNSDGAPEKRRLTTSADLRG